MQGLARLIDGAADKKRRRRGWGCRHFRSIVVAPSSFRPSQIPGGNGAPRPAEGGFSPLLLAGNDGGATRAAGRVTGQRDRWQQVEAVNRQNLLAAPACTGGLLLLTVQKVATLAHGRTSRSASPKLSFAIPTPSSVQSHT